MAETVCVPLSCSGEAGVAGQGFLEVEGPGVAFISWGIAFVSSVWHPTSSPSAALVSRRRSYLVMIYGEKYSTNKWRHAHDVTNLPLCQTLDRTECFF